MIWYYLSDVLFVGTKCFLFYRLVPGTHQVAWIWQTTRRGRQQTSLIHCQIVPWLSPPYWYFISRKCIYLFCDFLLESVHQYSCVFQMFFFSSYAGFRYIHLSIHFLYPHNPIQGHGGPGAYLYCHWVRGRVSPGQAKYHYVPIMFNFFFNWKYINCYINNYSNNAYLYSIIHVTIP